MVTTVDLADFKLFAGCSRTEIQRARSLSTSAHVSAGTALTLEGAYSHECMVMLSGSATVERSGEPIDTVGPGDVIGELGLLDNGYRSRRATVRATTDCDLLVFSSAEFATLLNDVPRLAARIGTTAVRRLAASLTEIEPTPH